MFCGLLAVYILQTLVNNYPAYNISKKDVVIMQVQPVINNECWQAGGELLFFFTVSSNTTCINALCFFFPLSLCHTHICFFCVFFYLTSAAG